MPTAPARARTAVTTRRRGGRVARVALTALAAFAVAAPAPALAAERRPTSFSGPTGTARWTPPAPVTDSSLRSLSDRVLGYDAAVGRVTDQGLGIFLPQTADGPLAFTVEAEAVAIYGEAAIRGAVEQFNGVRGTRFRVVLAGTTSENVRGPRADGVWRIFVDDETCSGSDLAWSHVVTVDYDHVYGAGQLAVSEVDLGLCRQLTGPKLRDSIGHELLHIAGMGHLCNAGQACWRVGMDNDNTCRLLYPSARSCQVFTELDAQALAYLHPAVPRLSGPGRSETAARVNYAANGVARTSTEVVLVDGGKSVDLAIQAAAFAATKGAPLLLTSTAGRCTEGAWGDELNRTATSDATVYLVGAMRSDCATDLQGWGLDVVLLANGRALADATVGPAEARASGPTVSTLPLIGGALVGLEPATRTTTDDILLVTRAAIDNESPDALAAAAVAGGLNAPVLYSSGDALTASAKAWLDGRPEQIPGRVIVVGGVKAVPASVVAQLESYGASVERIAGPSRIDTAIALARMNEAFGTSRPQLLVAAADRWADTVAASALGGASGTPVILVYKDSVPQQVTDYLNETGAAGVIVGGPGVVSDATQLQLSRTVRRLPAA